MEQTFFFNALRFRYRKCHEATEEREAVSTKPLGTHTHSTIAVIEDLTAVGLDAKMEIEIALQRMVTRRGDQEAAAAEYALLYVLARLTKMMDILTTVRGGPYAYRRDEAENLETKPE
jgi:hypothetical protein